MNENVVGNHSRRARTNKEGYRESTCWRNEKLAQQVRIHTIGATFDRADILQRQPLAVNLFAHFPILAALPDDGASWCVRRSWPRPIQFELGMPCRVLTLERAYLRLKWSCDSPANLPLPWASPAVVFGGTAF